MAVLFIANYINHLSLEKHLLWGMLYGNVRTRIYSIICYQLVCLTSIGIEYLKEVYGPNLSFFFFFFFFFFTKSLKYLCFRSYKGTTRQTKNQHILCSISKLSTPFSCMVLNYPRDAKNALSYWSKQCFACPAWPTKILILFLSSLDNLLWDAYIITRLKNEFYVSKLVTDWKTWPKCIFVLFCCFLLLLLLLLLLFLFCFVFVFVLFWFFFPVSSRRVRFEFVTALFSMKYGTCFLNEHDTRQNTVEVVCCSKCFIVSFISFHVYFDKQVHKNMKKIKHAKIRSLNFAESNTHRKTNASDSFET